MCVTCCDQPLMHCTVFPNEHPPTGCFITCPECNRRGFAESDTDFVPDNDLAKLFRTALRR